MFKDELKETLFESVKKLYPKIAIGQEEIELETPKKPEFGDLASNIGFRIAKRTYESPEKITEGLFDYLFNHWPSSLGQLSITIPVSGFLNFKFTCEYYITELAEILTKKNKYGNTADLKGKKYQVEFISANPTGPLTLANGRGGFGGDVLANVLTKAGAKVEREYLVNDGGNQVRILGDSILASLGAKVSEEDIYRGEYIDEWAQNHTKECEDYQDNSQKLGQLAAQEILDNHIKKSVARMNIKFDHWFSERELIEKGEVDKALIDFKKRGLSYEKDGALWFKTTEFGDDKDRVLRKADGENTYFANDAAYHWDKFSIRKFDKVINLWGADHHGYIQRMMAATEAMGFAGQLDIVLMQLVRLIQDGQEVRMSKRKGKYITMDDLLELIGGEGMEASDVARFFFLSRAFNTHMDFDLDLARKNSEQNPVFYVKYAYARISGILKNAEKLTLLPKGDLSLIKEVSELGLIKELSHLADVVTDIATDPSYPVQLLTFYTQSIATKFHAFYDNCRVIDETNPELTAARLELVKATQIVLGITARDLLGIKTPEKM